MANKKIYENFDANFTNIVPGSESTRNTMMCDGNIMLEPRLQEYLRKKQYYKANDIEPMISLEKEYQITQTDIKLLRSFLSGKRDIYSRDNYNQTLQTKTKKAYFPSKDFR